MRTPIGALALVLPLALAGTGSAFAAANAGPATDTSTDANSGPATDTSAGANTTAPDTSLGANTGPATDTSAGANTTAPNPSLGANATVAAKCSEATLHGRYLFAYEGFTVGGKDRGPVAVAGYEEYDGRGHARSISTSSTNGKIARFARTTAKYTVKPDCTGTVSYSDGTRYDQFIAPDGSLFVFVQTNPGTVATGFEPSATARRVSD